MNEGTARSLREFVTWKLTGTMLSGAGNLEDQKSCMLNFKTHFLYIVFDLICILEHSLCTPKKQAEFFQSRPQKQLMPEGHFPLPFPDWAEPRISAIVHEEFWQPPDEKIAQECFHITATSSEPCQSQGQIMSDAGQRESHFNKVLLHPGYESGLAWMLQVVKIRLLLEEWENIISL